MCPWKKRISYISVKGTEFAKIHFRELGINPKLSWRTLDNIKYLPETWKRRIISKDYFYNLNNDAYHEINLIVSRKEKKESSSVETFIRYILDIQGMRPRVEVVRHRNNLLRGTELRLPRIEDQVPV